MTLPQFREGFKLAASAFEDSTRDNSVPHDDIVLSEGAARLRGLGLYHTEEDPRVVPVSLSVDGVSPLSLSAKYSVWPVVLGLPCLPIELRHQDGAMPVVGLFEGPGKPSQRLMQLMLSTIVDELQVLEDGVLMH